jgi:hypothetical protein
MKHDSKSGDTAEPASHHEEEFMKLRYFASSLSAALVLWAIAATPARADLSSQPVTVDYLYPTITSVYEDLGSGTVTATGFTVSSFGQNTYTVYDSQIVLKNVLGEPVSFDPGSFNGYEMTETGGSPAAITGVTLDGATNVAGVTSSDISFDATDVWLNMEGITTQPGQVVVLDLDFGGTPTPEPGLKGLGLVLMLGIAGCGWKFRRTKVRGL